MTDLEMTKLCAEAMGYRKDMFSYHWGGLPLNTHEEGIYDPLHDDAQAMGLVKKLSILLFKPALWQAVPSKEWNKGYPGMYISGEEMYLGENADLNRAIVECVAKMQVAK